MDQRPLPDQRIHAGGTPEQWQHYKSSSRYTLFLIPTSLFSSEGNSGSQARTEAWLTLHSFLIRRIGPTLEIILIDSFSTPYIQSRLLFLKFSGYYAHYTENKLSSQLRNKGQQNLKTDICWGQDNKSKIFIKVTR